MEFYCPFELQLCSKPGLLYCGSCSTQFRMWRTRLSRTWDWLRSRRLVGEDEHHLYYSEFVAKDKPERRYVEYKDNNITHSSDRMPIEWWSWLHNRRDDAPTDDEIVRSEQKQQILAARVAMLEAEDEKQRLRQFAGGSVKTKATREEAMAKRRNKAMQRLAQAASSPQDGSSESARSIVSSPVQGHEDRPHGHNDEEHPKGAGEDFQPGSWQPAQGRKRGK